MKLLISLCLFFTGITCSFAQNEDLLLQFSAVQVGNKVQLNFTIKAGNTCNGIVIYSSTDSTNLTEIGDIQGICGSSDRNESYTYIHHSPAKNTTNFYRLQLGVLGYTYITRLFFIQPEGNSALLFPHPLTGESVIRFLNASNEAVKLTIYDIDGKVIYESNTIHGNSFGLSKEDFGPGLYLYSIDSDKRRLFRGKFVVL